MQWRPKLQLRLLVPLIVLMGTSLLILFMALYNYQIAKQSLVDNRFEQIKRTLALLQQEIEHNATQPNYINNSQRLLMSQSVDSSIQALTLIDQSGQVVLANRMAWKGSQASEQLPYFDTTSTTANSEKFVIELATDGNSIQAYMPLKLAPVKDSLRLRERGLLYASYDLSRMKAALWQQTSHDSSLIWLVTSILLFNLVLILDKLVTRPLARLAAFAQEISQQQSGLQIKGSFVGEISRLAQTLNHMSQQVSQTLKTITSQQENLEVTLHSIGDAVIATDNTGLVTRMNPVAEQLTGWYAFEARGLPLKTIFPIIDASTRETIPNPIDKVLATGETVYLSNHTTLIAKDGSEYQIADSAAPILNTNNEIEGMVLVFNNVTEQYKLRQVARNIQRQIQGLFDDMQTMAGILDIDGTIMFMNNTPLKIRGLELEDVAGKKLWECAWFDYGAIVQDAIHADCLEAARGKPILRDLQISTAEGDLLWVQFSIHTVTDEQGQVIQLLAEGHDISQRKKAEEELNASMQHIKLYREQTPLATIEWNMDFQIEDWNEAASELFGYARDEVIGCDASIIVHESAVPGIDHIWESIVHHNGGGKRINNNFTKDGRSILCEWHNRPIVNQANEVVGIASLVLDITSEHEAKLALIKKEQEQREILNTLLEGIITIDEKGEILNLNPAAEKIFGYTSEDISGKDLSTIMPNFNIDKADQYLGHHTKAGRADTLDGLHETTGLRKNKATFPLQASAAELPPASDGTRRFIASCNDLTETKLQQGHLQRTQKMDALGKIVGGIAHDYNNMLGVILGYADLMAIKYQDIDGLNKYIEHISLAGERGRNLTKRMLAFSKQESAQSEAIELHTLLAEQQELLSKSITALIKLDYHLCEAPWLVWLDPGELQDTLLNLAINAKHAMSDGGVLTLTTCKRHLPFAVARALGLVEGDYMELSVADNGCGISEEFQMKIFDPFFTTKGNDGTGLGLSQAYGFMDRCGGTIRVESSPNHGSKFSLYFPRHKGTAARPIVLQDKPTYSPPKARKILIVDDEPALRELTREILSIAGYKVLIASDGDTALAILTSESVDLMISDIIMPKMNGYELAKIVGEKYPLIKIQLASGYSSDQAIDEDLAPLHNSILRKPFRASELLNTVAQLLEAQDNAR